MNRPLTGPAEPPPRGKKVTSHPVAPPVTEGEIVGALERLAGERVQAFEIIEHAGDRREQLLLTDGSDDEILGLGREVDAANLMLERIDRLEPDLRFRLRQVRDQAKVERFAALRDAYIASGRKHLEALRAAAIDTTEVAAARAAVLEEFRGAKQVLPQFPALPRSEIDRFEAELNRFAITHFDADPPPVTPYIRVTEIEASGIASIEHRPEVAIRALAGYLALDGRWIDKGSTVIAPGAEAYRHIVAGRAQLVNEEEAA